MFSFFRSRRLSKRNIRKKKKRNLRKIHTNSWKIKYYSRTWEFRSNFDADHPYFDLCRTPSFFNFFIGNQFARRVTVNSCEYVFNFETVLKKLWISIYKNGGHIRFRNLRLAIKYTLLLIIYIVYRDRSWRWMRTTPIFDIGSCILRFYCLYRSTQCTRFQRFLYISEFPRTYLENYKSQKC